MSAVDLYREAQAQLASGDSVTPIESLKVSAVSLRQRLEEVDEWPEGEETLDPLGDGPEELLAVAWPLLEHGGESGALTVASAMRSLTRDLGVVRQRPSEAANVLLVHHLLWASAAFCLANDRLRPLKHLSAIVVAKRHGGEVEAFADSDLRHADAFGHEADATYAHGLKWLIELSLCEAIPHLSHDDDAEAAMGEAELIAALICAGPDQGQVYTAVIGTDGSPQRRLVSRVRDRSQAPIVAEIFGIAPDALVETLEERYGRLVTDQLRFRTRVRLFGPDE